MFPLPSRGSKSSTYLPVLWLLWRRKRRLKAFAAQLPDALEMLSRALRAGQSLAAGFNEAAQRAAKWTAEHLEESNLRYLGRLPPGPMQVASEIATLPGSATSSKRAATLTASPKISSSSCTTSPIWTPILSLMIS